MDRHGFLVLLAAVILAAAVVPGLVAMIPRGRMRLAHRVARKVDLALDGPAGSLVVRRLAHRELVASAVATVAGALTLLVVAPLEVSYGAFQYDLLWLVVAVMGGRAVGASGAAVYETLGRSPRTSVRVARMSTPSHGDYVAPIERVGAWAVAALSALLSAGLLLTDVTGVVDLGGAPWPVFVLAAVVPALAVALDELVARRVLARPQRAETPLGLAWDDALRSRALRDMVTVPLTVGMLSPLVLLGVVGEGIDGGWPENPAAGLVSGLVILVLLAMLVAAAVSVAQRPERHFRQRLWGAGQAARP
jgi:hypothetical protein